MKRKMLILSFVLILLISYLQVIYAKEIELLKQVELDERIVLSNQIEIENNHLYLPAHRLPLDIYIYSISDQLFKKKVTYYLEYGQVPRINVYENRLFFVDRKKRSVVFLDQSGKIKQKILLQNTHSIDEEPGNVFNIVFDGSYLYLNNHFIKEKAYVLQKYDLNSTLVCQTEQFPFIQLLKNENYLYAVYFETVLKLDDQLQVQDTYLLKSNDFNMNSSYAFHKNLFVALDTKMNIHVTDFKDSYKIISLKNYINFETKNITDLLLFDNGETMILVDKSTNSIFEFKMNI